jgi:hypothetical protein
LKLSSDFLVSKFAFKFNLYCYSERSPSEDGGIGGPGTYYHARTCMPIENTANPGEPMTDSDDEEYFRAWAREDYRHLSDFEDVVNSEKLFMHNWNVFMRRYTLFAEKAGLYTLNSVDPQA